MHLPVVSRNVLPKKFRPQRSVTSVLYPMIAMLLIALMVFIYQVKADNQAGIAGIQDELNGISRQLDEMSPNIETVNNIEAEVNSLQEEREYVIGPGNFADSLQLVLGALPSEVRLTSVGGATDQISLDGDADSPSNVTDYVAALEQTGGFSSVYVASLSGGSPSTFGISCSTSDTGTTQ